MTSFNGRRDKRIYGVFPVFLRGNDVGEHKIKTQTIVDNISQGGLFLQLPQFLSCGTTLFTLVKLPNNIFLAAKGEIVRVENKEHELKGFGVRFKQTRLIQH
ncbi:MAG: PilZ domain-containing protein [Methylococcaceae bacterium]